MILYINSCVRADSRTDKIARALLGKYHKEYVELYLPEEDLKPLSKELLDKRTALIEKDDYSDPLFGYAKQFAKADKIIISAPFWDFSFPAILKLYIENIYVTGIVSKYGNDGMPIGLCKADELIFVTTAGGPYIADFGYNYIKTLAIQCFGIKNVRLIKAEMLDIEGADVESILSDVIDKLPQYGTFE